MANGVVREQRPQPHLDTRDTPAQVGHYQPLMHINTMAQGHLQLIERELRALLAEGNTEEIVKWTKERILESYRNGIKAGKVAPATDTERSRPHRARHYQQ